MGKKKLVISIIMLAILLTTVVALATSCGGKSFYVTYNYNYIDEDGRTFEEVVHNQAKEKIKSFVPENREGYIFIEWQYNGVKFNFDTNVESDITLYAIWEVSYNVTLKYNDREEKVAVAKDDKLDISNIGYSQNDGVIEGYYLEIGENPVLFDIDQPIEHDITIYVNTMTEGLVFDKNSIVGYNGDDQNVVIPMVYNGYEITTIADIAFAEDKIIKTINLDNRGLTTIGVGAFVQSNLTELELPWRVKTLGRGAFSGSKLEKISMEENDVFTHHSTDVLRIIPADCFSDCEDLEEVILSGSIQEIHSNAFYANNLETIKIPGAIEYKQTGVIIIGEKAFSSRNIDFLILVYMQEKQQTAGYNRTWNFNTKEEPSNTIFQPVKVKLSMPEAKFQDQNSGEDGVYEDGDYVYLGSSYNGHINREPTLIGSSGTFVGYSKNLSSTNMFSSNLGELYYNFAKAESLPANVEADSDDIITAYAIWE